MLEENAVVVDLDGEYAWVETQRQTACGSCSVNKGCGTSVISKVVGNKRNRVRALNRADAREGDSVVVGIQQNALIHGSLAVYIAPLVGMLLGALVGGAFSQYFGVSYSEGASILFSLSGLVVGFIWLKRFNRRHQSSERFQAVVLRVQETPINFVCDSSR